MFRLPSWKHHWNPSSFPQVHEPTKGRPRNATHESRPVDAQESRALRNPVQSNSWVHEFRWEFLGEIMENHGKLSWENHGKSMGNDGNLFSGHLFLDEIPHVKKYGIPSTSPRGRTRCLPYAKKKTSSVHPPFLAMKSPIATGSMHFFLLQTVQNHLLFIVEIYQMLDMLALY